MVPRSALMHALFGPHQFVASFLSSLPGYMIIAGRSISSASIWVSTTSTSLVSEAARRRPSIGSIK